MISDRFCDRCQNRHAVEVAKIEVEGAVGVLVEEAPDAAEPDAEVPVEAARAAEERGVGTAGEIGCSAVEDSTGR